jgi:hypothetical protein
MTLLDSYLSAVGRCLSRKQRADIVAELREEMLSQLEARQAELGRPLTDVEQYAVFLMQGDPMTVARRYSPNRRSLSLGWELIGPELFPAYLFVLGLNLAITLTVIPLSLLTQHFAITPGAFVLPVLGQIVCVTAVFIILNFVRLKFPHQWIYPPAELATVIPPQRWYSISGLVACSLLTAWWIAIPQFQFLVLGSAAGELELAPVWRRYYVPIMLLFFAGMGQRALSAGRPYWTWVLPTFRTVISGTGAFVMFFFRTHLLVVIKASVRDVVQAEKHATSMNNFLRWGLFGPWLWIYLAIGALIYASYTLPHLRHLLSGGVKAVAIKTELTGIV